jgi:hypothetical protein
MSKANASIEAEQRIESPVTNKLDMFLPEIERLQLALQRLDTVACEPEPPSDDNPLFLASIGWRTGSTLMQRIMMTDPNILMWGEPMDRCVFFGRITDALSAIIDDWPAIDTWISHRQDIDLSGDWVATLSPDAGRLKAGLLAMADTWLAKPARARGFTRWGVKDVRMSGQDGMVLRWLYPNSRFVLIVRHPVSSFHSMLQYDLRPGWGLWARWPDRFVDSIETYAALWSGLATSWINVADRLGVRIIRYEDLVAGVSDIGGLGASLGLKLQPSVALARKVGDNSYVRPMSAEERDRVNQLTAEARALFAYAE